jgi:hypothetical protein
MKPLKYLNLFLAILLLSNLSVAQQVKLNWYPFDRDFINKQYSDSAIGELTVKKLCESVDRGRRSCRPAEGIPSQPLSLAASRHLRSRVVIDKAAS